MRVVLHRKVWTQNQRSSESWLHQRLSFIPILQPLRRKNKQMNKPHSPPYASDGIVDLSLCKSPCGKYFRYQFCLDSANMGRDVCLLLLKIRWASHTSGNQRVQSPQCSLINSNYFLLFNGLFIFVVTDDWRLDIKMSCGLASRMCPMKEDCLNSKKTKKQQQKKTTQPFLNRIWQKSVSKS